MQPDVFLIRFGAWLVPALAIGACVAALAVFALARAWRVRRGARLFAPPLVGARWGLRGARAGERVIARGRLALTRAGVAPFDGRAPCAIASARTGASEVCRAAQSLELQRALQHGAPLLGPIDLDGSCDARTLLLVPDAVVERLRAAGLHVDDDAEGAIALSHVRDGETVLVLGRATRAPAPEGRTYRDDAGRLGIGPDDDGRVHVVGIGTKRAHAWRVARVGLPVGLLAASALLFVAPFASMYAPRSEWSIPQERGELPHSLWLPLASPWRAHALREASRWLTSEDGVEGGAPHAIELARALRDVAPDCRRESRLTARHGWAAREGAVDDCDTWIAREASTTADQPDLATAIERLRVLAIALDRGAALDPAVLSSPVHALACPECGPISGGDPDRDAWLVAATLLGVELRSERMRRFRGEWLADLAIWQAARGHAESPRASDPVDPPGSGLVARRTPRGAWHRDGADQWEPALSRLLAGSERDLGRGPELRRARRATELLVEADDGTPTAAGAPELTLTELEAAVRDAADTLPQDSELRARIDRFGLRVTHWATGPRGRAITLARLAVVVEDAGARDAARDLARLSRRTAEGVPDPSLARFQVLVALVPPLP